MKFGLGSASGIAGAMQGFAGVENQKMQYQQDQNKDIAQMMADKGIPFDQAHAIVTNDIAALKKLGLYQTQPVTSVPTTAPGAPSMFSPTSPLFPTGNYGIGRYFKPPDTPYFVVPPIASAPGQVSAPQQPSANPSTPGATGTAGTTGAPSGTAGGAGAPSGSGTSPPQSPPVSTGSADGNPPGNWFGIDPSTGLPTFNPNGAGLGSNQQYGKELTPKLGKGHFGKAIEPYLPYAIGQMLPGGIAKDVYPDFLRPFGPEGDALARRLKIK